LIPTEEGRTVHASVTTFEGSAGTLGEGAREACERVLLAARPLPGFKGMYLLADGGSSKALAVTLWENEEAMRASEEAANRLREQSAASMGVGIRAVDPYEVVVAELED
jgi:heme-degrading monooxygenase HmoA